MKSARLFVSILALTTPAFAAVNVSSPAPNSTVGSPVQYIATSSSGCGAGVAAMGIYVNDQLQYVSNGATLNTTLALSPGSYNTVVQEWDNCGGATLSSVPITVASAGITVAAPASGSAVNSPVAFNATASSSCSAGVAAMGIYINDQLKYVVNGSTLNTSLSLPAGSYYTVVQDWDNCGSSSKQPLNITVTGSTTPGVNVSSPAGGSTVSSPVNYAATSSTSCAAGVASIGIYVNNQLQYVSNGSALNTSLSLSPGAYNTVVQDWDYCGNSSMQAVSITVAGPAGTPAVPASRHVVLLMEENSSYSSVVGSSAWPNLNSLIAQGALPTQYYANSHPSIGNYFMLTTGQILTTDDNSTQVWNVPSIARQMLAAGVPFRIYAEGISQGYLGGDTGLYVIRHNPFAMLSDIANNPSVANQVIQPFSQFATDLASGNLPQFSFIVPNVDDDAHDGTPQQADAWLQTNVVQPLSNDPAFQPGGDGLLVVDFDEGADTDTAYGGGQVSPVLWGPNVRPGYQQQSNSVYQHPSMLLTIDQALGLSNPPAAAATAPSMSEFFVQK
ncbi:MAG TPA: alkaline phosphatase family protein [Acidobacteriaceae bacterium]|nr:alkaline phosphatase family protein [Acidobacteriaceae bacterium]